MIQCLLAIFILSPFQIRNDIEDVWENALRFSCGFCLLAGIGGRLGGKAGLKKLEQEGVLDVFNKAGDFEFRVLKKDLDERLSTDMHTACLEIPETCRVLTVHGSADEIVPSEDAQEFAKRIRNHVVHIIDGADHNYKQQQLEIATLVVNFLQPHLQQLSRSLL